MLHYRGYQAKDLIKYNILNKHKLPYDVIINAYATNDMHIHSAREAEKMHVTLAESVFDINQSFIVEIQSLQQMT